MKPNLYLITTDFPYGRGETSFILPELPYLRDKFNVTIISNSLSDEQTVELDDDVTVLHYDRKASFVQKIWDSVCFFGHKSAYMEMLDIIKSRKKVLKRLQDSILFFEEARRFARYLKKGHVLEEGAPSVIYCYWFTYYCFTLTEFFSNDCKYKLITRTHRYDLYDDGYQGKRQPFKRQMDKSLDGIVFIAEHGRQYYLEKYCGGAWNEKYQLFRLGVKPLSVATGKRFEKHEEFHLVSCSLVIPRKRVELIVDALTEITEFKIRWTHFGDGCDYERLCEYATDKLGDRENVVVECKGFVESYDIMKYYGENDIDAFITTTASEGCPVSVQEAMAYGIPIIGTTVAEIPYMICENGILLSENPDKKEIADAIVKIHDLTEDETMRMRKNSYALWNKMFNLEENALKFVKYLEHMADTKKENL